MAKTDGRRGESALIEHYFAPLCDPETAFGLTDDAAMLSVPDGQQLVLTKDMLVADIHFFADDAPDLIARKALRVNLSDLAAKGAKPLGYMLGLGLPSDWTEAWLAGFCAGLKQDQQQYSFPLIGGDTVKSPERLTLSVTAFGLVGKGVHPLRRNAQAGNNLYVSGTIGDSALGLKAMQNKLGDAISKPHSDFLKDRFLLPQPRLDLAALVRRFATASMDISDGLLGDAAKMAKAASVCLVMQENAIPLSGAVRALLHQDQKFWPLLLSGGDDYELLFCVPADKHQALMQAAEALKTPVTKIGTVEAGQGVRLVDPDGNLTVLDGTSAYEHF